jgi:hypothetical protein
MKRYLILMVIFVSAISACKKSNDATPIPAANQPYNAPPVPANAPTSGSRTLIGYVFDKDSVMLSNVDVYYYGTHTTTDANGKFQFNNVTSTTQRFVVQVRKAGYFPQDVGFTFDATGIRRLHVALLEKEFVATINSQAGGTVTHNNLTINIPADGFKLNGSEYTGKVNIFASIIDPTDKNFFNSMPGSDMRATNASNQVGSLVSDGAFLLEAVSESGQRLTQTDGSGKITNDPITYCVTRSVAPQVGSTAWGFVWSKAVWVYLTNVVVTNESSGYKICFTADTLLAACNLDAFFPPIAIPPVLTINTCDTNTVNGQEIPFTVRGDYSNGASQFLNGVFTATTITFTDTSGVTNTVHSVKQFYQQLEDAFVNGLTKLTVFKSGQIIYTTPWPASLPTIVDSNCQ